MSLLKPPRRLPRDCSTELTSLVTDYVSFRSLERRATSSRRTRAAFAGNYAVYYLVTETEVIVVRVLHGARDAAAIAERGGFA